MEKAIVYKFEWMDDGYDIYLCGSWNDWNFWHKLENNKVQVQVPISNEPFQYKFIVDGAWKVNPCYPTTSKDGHLNNLLILQKETCKMCCNKRIKQVFYPCGHFFCCPECAELIKESETNPFCPVCRTYVVGTTKIFY